MCLAQSDLVAMNPSAVAATTAGDVGTAAEAGTSDTVDTILRYLGIAVLVLAGLMLPLLIVRWVRTATAIAAGDGGWTEKEPITWIGEQLKAQCMACRSCGLCTTRNNVVFEAGNREAKRCSWAKAPANREDGRAFPSWSRRAILDEMLSIIDVDRKRCYIANIVKCRPPQNRDPWKRSRRPAGPSWKPKSSWSSRKSSCAWAASPPRSSSRPDYRITRSMAAGEQRDGVWMTAFYHPSALLGTSKRRTPFRTFWASGRS